MFLPALARQNQLILMEGALFIFLDPASEEEAFLHHRVTISCPCGETRDAIDGIFKDGIASIKGKVGAKPDKD